MHEFRTHTCGELRKTDIGARVRVSGWIHNKRDHGGVLFIDLRDHYGITQVVVYPTAEFQYDVGHLPKETVVRFDGEVAFRSEENINPKMPTGEIEVNAEAFEVLGICESLPFTVFQEEEVTEDLRLKYRIVDLRRSRVHQNIVLRSGIIASIRRRMNELGFNEYQTPILTSSSPEGARDYLVPSRLYPGKFYALPQAPQQFKQLLMVAGFDRYFQIAPCFRDEDARADRSPGEFYQLDIEMAFATQDDVFDVVENVLHGVFSEFSSNKVDPPPFLRIPYRESMLKYGTDKPDLRIPIEMCDVSSVFEDSEFRAFRSAVAQGAVVRAIPVKGISARPRSFFDKLVAYAQSIGAQGLAYLVWEPDKVKGPLAKFLTGDQLAAIASSCGIGTGDVVFFVCAPKAEAERLSGEVRLRLGAELDMIARDEFRFCWVVDFPMYEYNAETKKVEFSHNPFSMPQGGLQALESQDPLDVLAYQYDIVCNGVELSSGAIRNHRPDIMYKAFEIAGYDRSVVDAKFGGMVNAFKLGAPPHGGIAPGIDRVVMLIAGVSNIREVIAFPMNQRAQDLMMNAPAEVSADQLRELHIRVTQS
ncbi:MAG: aspartate--tRNA ligase [Chitinivibrionales bacterium]|nr:aspartate--tRNA ligase [Chitinivibrionales bacterium]MBD3395866.1 aspartate--tRNA ligase [Chitinivibrionales bacterium]